MAIAAAKARARELIRARREARSPADRQLCAQALATHLTSLLPSQPTDVAAYLSLPTEPGTGPAIDMLLGAGHRVLVPRITPEGLAWVAFDPAEPRSRGPMGIDEPQGPPEPGGLRGASVLLLPGLAVDRAGRRLGQGGGYVDRALAGVPAHESGGPLRVVVLFADEVLDDVPVEPHDCRVDAALTPEGVVTFT